MRYVLRVGIPDRPGALGAVASALGEACVDIESLEVIDRWEGMAYDDVRVVTTVGAQRLRTIFEAVPGVVVEAVHDVPAVDGASPTGLAAAVAEDGGLHQLVHGLPAALHASWAVAVGDGSQGLVTHAASVGAPDLPAGLRIPCFPLKGVRRLPQAAWMPAQWRGDAGSCEIAAAVLDAPYAAVLLGRRGGPRFRPNELQRLGELARIAVATGRTAPAAGGAALSHRS